MVLAVKDEERMMTFSLFQQSAAFIQQRYPHPIQIVCILGSGMGDLAAHLENPVEIPYSDIPNFPESTTEGHCSALALGQLAQSGKHVAFLKGRFHFYEGYAMEKVVYPLRVLKMLGATQLLVTNAAGGVNPNFKAGDLMLIEDHLNMMGTNPLIGKNLNEFGPRFPDMSEAYTPRLRELALQTAMELNIPIQRGIYCAISGPSYETPAEIRMFRMLGADAIGMSTVPEVIAASHMGMQVVGISCITNAAAGVLPHHKLSHEEVLAAAEAVKAPFSRLIEAILERI